MELSQEDMKNMSPEQLKELQKKNCIFCHIVSGAVASKKMFEDNELLGILDINPANPGHVLLMPKEHHMVMPQMPDPDINHMFMVAKGISNAVLKGLKAKGTNLFIANGALAGQKSPHFMMHVIPRMEGDGLNVFMLKRTQPRDLEKLQKTLEPKLYGLMGKQPPEHVDSETGSMPPVKVEPEAPEAVEPETEAESEAGEAEESEAEEPDKPSLSDIAAQASILAGGPQPEDDEDEEEDSEEDEDEESEEESEEDEEQEAEEADEEDEGEKDKDTEDEDEESEEQSEEPEDDDTVSLDDITGVLR
ncbi:MAG: HIT domain-containing protein [Nanoarchaeota archaeon]|nr:HIT domain-containing protein [Nanoarchaeota archaeon]